MNHTGRIFGLYFFLLGNWEQKMEKAKTLKTTSHTVSVQFWLDEHAGSFLLIINNFLNITNIT